MTRKTGPLQVERAGFLRKFYKGVPFPFLRLAPAECFFLRLFMKKCGRGGADALAEAEGRAGIPTF
ncbi:MAG: hypothetical protein EGS36_06485 [Akkermansia muciniphila]|nr:hypothetical protein [Akkermansia muciniphila]MBE5700824.1 hypothetical protein [Akkermansia sp.]